MNHWNLFNKLIRRGVPITIIKLLVYWYSHQTFCVKCGYHTSDLFTVINGVRQGSILSPHLFAVYVDDLSSSLIRSSHGCRINDVVLNHLFYADDLCLMAPSPAALQVLINICSLFSAQHDLVFNPNKSMCMVIKPHKYKLNCPSLYIDNSELLFVDTVKYLGIFITSDLNDNIDMKRQLRSLYAR